MPFVIRFKRLESKEILANKFNNIIEFWQYVAQVEVKVIFSQYHDTITNNATQEEINSWIIKKELAQQVISGKETALKTEAKDKNISEKSLAEIILQKTLIMRLCPSQQEMLDEIRRLRLTK